MASQGKINQLKNKIDEISSIDLAKLLRPDLGSMSLKAELGPIFNSIILRLKGANELMYFVSDSDIDRLMSVLNKIHSHMNTSSEMDDKSYVTNRDTFRDQVIQLNDQFTEQWRPFIIAKLEKSGLLEDTDLKDKYKIMMQNINEEASEVIGKVSEESKKVIGEARAEAKDIERSARKTAAKISVKDAQEQFAEANRALFWQVILWGILSSSAAVAFFLAAISFYKYEVPTGWQWHVIYYSVLRVTILAAIGAIVAFLLKILRAHLHMYQHNKHRIRLANSMTAFVESAISDSQRDLILTHLVDAVATFGHSGLLQKEEDNIYSPKMTIDTITRNIAPIAGD